jgi:hypothetical protein
MAQQHERLNTYRIRGVVNQPAKWQLVVHRGRGGVCVCGGGGVEGLLGPHLSLGLGDEVQQGPQLAADVGCGGQGGHVRRVQRHQTQLHCLRPNDASLSPT